MLTTTQSRESVVHTAACAQKLEDVAEAPQLPASYPVMMLLALLPGMFFDVMDPRALRVAQLRGQKINT